MTQILCADEKQRTLVDHDLDNQWIAIRVVGEIHAGIAIDALRQGLQQCQEQSCPRLLFDARETVLTETFLGGYDLAKNFAKVTGVDYRYKCGVVYNPRHYPVDRADMMGTVAQNWGNVALRMFPDRAAAADWLRELNSDTAC